MRKRIKHNVGKRIQQLGSVFLAMLMCLPTTLAPVFASEDMTPKVYLSIPEDSGTISFNGDEGGDGRQEKTVKPGEMVKIEIDIKDGYELTNLNVGAASNPDFKYDTVGDTITFAMPDTNVFVNVGALTKKQAGELKKHYRSARSASKPVSGGDIKGTGAHVYGATDPESGMIMAWWADMSAINVDGAMGLCIQPLQLNFAGDYWTENMSSSQAKQLGLIQWYAYEKDGGSGWDRAVAQYMTWETLGYVIQFDAPDFGAYYQEQKPKIQAKIAADKGEIESTGVIYRSAEGQDVVRLTNQLAKGSFTAVKTSDSSSVTSGNPTYSLEGAEYMLYTNSDATSAVTPMEGTLPLKTDANGNMNTIAIRPGTYYFKETKAPAKGYGINPNIIKVTVTAGNTTTLRLTGDNAEPAMFDPINIMVQKAVKEMDSAGQANGNISNFAGAEFRISYYNGLYDTVDAAKASGSPKASAVWATDKIGYVNFAMDKPVSGSWPYKDEFNFNTIPLGTVVIDEVKGIPGTITSGHGRVVQFVDSGDHKNATAIVKEPWDGNKNDAVMAFDNVSYKGGVTIVKADADTKLSKPQGDADLANVVYSIYNRSTSPVRAFVNGIWTTTPVNGKVMDIKTVYDSVNKRYVATTGNHVLPYGSYEAVETSSSTGYANNGWKQTFSITADGQMVSFDSASKNWNTNSIKRYGVVIGKMDRDSDQYLQLGGASLEGVTFQITNLSKNNVVVDGKTIAPNGVVGTIATKKEVTADGKVHYVARSRADWLPWGKYKAVELNSGKGYLYDSTSKAWTATFSVGYDAKDVNAWTDADNGYADLRSSAFAAKNKVSRNDWNFQKKLLDNGNGNNVGARIPFVITSKTTGEKHVIVTDDNGVWGSAWYAHTANTNSNDPDSPNSNGAIGINSDGTYYVKDESKLNPEAGTWFTGADPAITQWASDMRSYTLNGNKVSVDDALGAFPYDNYSVEELHVSINKDYFMPTVDVVLHYKDGHDFDYGTINNRMEAQPEIGTELTYGDTGKIAPAAEKVTLLDRVSYNNLKLNENYVLKGELHYVDAEGTDKGAIAKTEATFKASGVGNGTTEVKFENVDTRTYGDGHLVAFEYLYKDGEKVASHEDIDDENQSVRVPSIKTTLIGQDEHEGDASSAVINLVDTVKFTNLEVGKNYTVTGTLHIQSVDKDGNVTDGGVLLDKDGKEITSTTIFAPSEANGSVNVAFTFENVDIAGKKLVAFEEVSLGDVTFATHADITDEGQTVSFIDVKTKASDKNDKDNEIIADKKQSVIDTVTLSNLTIGKEYEVNGVLHVRSRDAAGTVVDEGVLKDEKGNDVHASAKIKAKKTTEEVKLEFNFDASKLAGKDVVVFEKVSRGDITLGEHMDIMDEDQTIHIPKIATAMVDKLGAKFIDLDKVEEDGMVTLVDTISYENLQVGKTYEATGTLHTRNIAEDGSVSDGGVLVIDGKEVTASAEFTPKSTNGIVDVTFTFNVNSMEADSVVAYEHVVAVQKDGSKSDVAKHEDIKDEKQTIQFGEIKTSVVSDKSESQMLEYNKEEVTLTDTVSYTGLTIGKTYHVNGVLHKAVVDDGTSDETEDEVTDKSEDENAGVMPMGAGAGPVEDEGNSNNGNNGNDSDNTENKDTENEGTVETPVKYRDGGVLLDRNGNEVRGTATFVAESVDGTVDVQFTFSLDETFEDTRLVVFEEVVDDNIVIMTHEDIEDEAQSMFVLNMATKAASANGEKIIAAAEEVEVIDTVVYENLVAGQEYTLLGTLMLRDDENGTSVAKNSDGEDVVTSITFTPETTSGTVDMTFVVDTRDLHERTLVAFERMTTENGTVIGVHEDINDENQSVTVDKETPQVIVELETGIRMGYIGLAVVGGIGAVLGTLAYRKRRKNEQKA